MAQTIAGFQGTVTEVQEAQRFGSAVARALVDSSASFKPTAQGTRTVAIAAGSMLCSGVLFIESAAQSIQLPANTAAGVRLDIVGLRFTWNGASSMVEVFSKQGTAGSATRPTLTRVPGSVYEFPLAVIRVRQNVGVIAAADVLDVRVWGGFGSPYQGTQADHIGVVDLPLAAQLQVGANLYTVIANDNAGNVTLSLIAAAATPWTAYDPVISSNDGACNLGAGGVRRGWYQLKDGACEVKFEIRTGTGTKNFGKGPIRIALPPGVRPSTVFADQWGDGLENTAVGDGFYNWPVKWLIRNDQNNYVVGYVATAGNDVRLLPMQSAGPGGELTLATPVILDGPGGNRVYAEPNVLTGSFSYITAAG
jgi:hypothetical protein